MTGEVEVMGHVVPSCRIEEGERRLWSIHTQQAKGD